MDRHRIYSPIRAATLAWAVHLPYIMDYVRWLTSLSNGLVHHGITTFLKTIKTLIHPNTGFLCTRTNLTSTLPNPAMVLGADFRALTVLSSRQPVGASMHAKCIERLRSIEGNKQKVAKARDPRDAIADILASPSPLKEPLRFIRLWS